MKDIENVYVSKEERYYVITYFRAQECIDYSYIFVFSVHVVMDNLLLTIKTPAVPYIYVIMGSVSNKNADLLNIVNKNRKLAALHDGTLLSNPRILKAFLVTNIRDINVKIQIAAQVVKWFIRLFTVPYFSVKLSRSSTLRYGLPSCMSVKTT